MRGYTAAVHALLMCALGVVLGVTNDFVSRYVPRKNTAVLGSTVVQNLIVS